MQLAHGPDLFDLPWPDPGGASRSSCPPGFLGRCTRGLKWNLGSVVTPRVCYMQFGKFGVFRVTCHAVSFWGLWLPALQKAPHVAQTWRELIFPHS